MKEITQQIKERIFALYYRQKVWNRIGWPGLVVNGVVDFKGQFTSFSDGDTKTFLELKSLSDITDEDALSLSAIMGCDKTDTKENRIYGAKERLFDYIENRFWKVYLEAIDFLRANGYALPAFGFSVDQLIEAGIFKLKTPTPDGK